MSEAETVAPDADMRDDASRCPCDSGDVFGSCCAPLLAGAAAPTASRLMRSRYTAFVLRDAGHLRATWHSSTRPVEIEFDEELRWRRLVIVDRTGGGPFDGEGTVSFEAQWRQGDERGTLRERSRFVREQRRWFYLDGEVG